MSVSSLFSSQMAPGYAIAVMGIDFTLRYFYKVLLDLLPICNQDKGNKIRYEEDSWMTYLLFFSKSSSCKSFLLSFFLFLFLLLPFTMNSFGGWSNFCFTEQEWNLQRDGAEKRKKEGRRDKLIITAFLLEMWHCYCLSPTYLCQLLCLLLFSIQVHSFSPLCLSPLSSCFLCWSSGAIENRD